jgi:hypothetical protein
MSGRFTRKMYDGCAIQQDLKQSTDPLELIMDVNKYVNCNNICKPVGQYPQNAASLVDVESSLWGIDKLASKCDSAKHPFCSPNGCLLTKDPRVPPHITPYACERGHVGDNAVITTNMQMPKHPGFRVPNPNICQSQGNGYYINPNKVSKQFVPQMRRHPPQISQNQSQNQPQMQQSYLAPLRNQQIQSSPVQLRNQQIQQQHPVIVRQ